MGALNRELGWLDALAPQVKEIVASATTRMWEPGLMLICAEIGLLSEARSIFERLVERYCFVICRDDMYVACLVFCAQTCCALADAGPAESLHRPASAKAQQAFPPNTRPAAYMTSKYHTTEPQSPTHPL